MEATHDQIQREGYSRKHIRKEDELRASARVRVPSVRVPSSDANVNNGLKPWIYEPTHVEGMTR
jgi:hypothetical protein